MALLFANHSASVYAQSETADVATKVVAIPSETAGVSLSCQIGPIRNEAVFDAVLGVEVLNPHKMKLEPEDIGSVPYGARVVWTETGQQFRVTKKAMLHAAGGELAELDYGEAEMELLERAD